MENKMEQEERLEYLVEAFKADSTDYKDLATPEDTAGRRRVLRSLMNIRMPRRLPDEVVRVQDEYLRGRAEERGIVDAERIPAVRDALGSRHAYGDRIAIWQGDITLLKCDAIVNAANSQMLGCFVPMHACIDNCIHTYAGVQLRAACNRQMNTLRTRYGMDYEQPTAEPMLTDGYNLPAKKVVHIVGPIVQDRLTARHERALADCYRNTLDLCLDNGLQSVAFCCISTGVFRFPAKRAAEIAVETVSAWLAQHESAPMKVIFNVFSDKDREYYEELLS